MSMLLSINEEIQEKGLSMRCLLGVNLLLLLDLQLCEAMYHDNRICLYYNERTFYQLIVVERTFPNVQMLFLL